MTSSFSIHLSGRFVAGKRVNKTT